MDLRGMAQRRRTAEIATLARLIEEEVVTGRHKGVVLSDRQVFALAKLFRPASKRRRSNATGRTAHTPKSPVLVAPEQREGSS